MNHAYGIMRCGEGVEMRHEMRWQISSSWIHNRPHTKCPLLSSPIEISSYRHQKSFPKKTSAVLLAISCAGFVLLMPVDRNWAVLIYKTGTSRDAIGLDSSVRPFTINEY